MGNCSLLPQHFHHQINIVAMETHQQLDFNQTSSQMRYAHK